MLKRWLWILAWRQNLNTLFGFISIHAQKPSPKNWGLLRNTDATAAEIQLNAAGSLLPTGANRTLTINGNIINNGTLANNSSYKLTVNAAGNIENNGTMSNESTVLTGTTVQSLTGTTAISKVNVTNNVSITGDPKIQYLTVNAGKTLTIGAGITSSISKDITNNGTINGGEILMNGTNQTLYGTGPYNVNKVTFGVSSVKYLGANQTVNCNMEILSGVFVKANGGSFTLIIKGNLVNGGTISNGSNNFTIYVYGNIDNNGTMSNYQTYAKWDAIQGATSYDFQLKTNGQWQTPISTGTNTYYSLNGYLTTIHEWRSRGIVNGTPTEWSASHLIN